MSTPKLYLHVLKERLSGKKEGACGNKIREGKRAERRSPDVSYTLRSRKGAIYISRYQIKIKLHIM